MSDEALLAEHRGQGRREVHCASLEEALQAVGTGKFNWQLCAVCGGGWLADNMWMQTISLTLPHIRREFDAHWVSGVLPSLMFAGGAVGATFWGAMSDRIGRRRAFSTTLGVAGVAGLGMAVAPDVALVCVAVFVVGFGIGGNMPIDGAMVSEFMDGGHRGPFMSALSAFWSFGSMVAGAIGWALLPPYSCDTADDDSPCASADNRGWRYTAAVVGVLNLLTLAARYGFPETPAWLLTRGRVADAEKVLQQMADTNGAGVTISLAPDATVAAPSAEQVGGDGERSASRSLETGHGEDHKQQQRPVGLAELLEPGVRKTTLLVWAIWFLTGAAFTNFNMFLPEFLDDRGMDSGSEYETLFIYASASVPGALLGAYCVESSLGRKSTMSVFTALTGVAVLVFLVSTTFVEVVVFTSLVNLMAQVMYAGIYVFTPEVYPTTVRATGVGAASSVSRVAGVISPLLAGWMIDAVSADSVLIVSVAGFAVSVAAMVALPYDTKGAAIG